MKSLLEMAGKSESATPAANQGPTSRNRDPDAAGEGVIAEVSKRLVRTLPVQRRPAFRSSVAIFRHNAGRNWMMTHIRPKISIPGGTRQPGKGPGRVKIPSPPISGHVYVGGVALSVPIINRLILCMTSGDERYWYNLDFSCSPTLHRVRRLVMRRTPFYCDLK